MLILSRGVVYRCSRKEYVEYLKIVSQGSDIPIQVPGRSWLLLQDSLTAEQSKELLARMEKELPYLRGEG